MKVHFRKFIKNTYTVFFCQVHEGFERRIVPEMIETVR